MDLEKLYEEINEIWPFKRTPQERSLEKEALENLVKTEEEATVLKNRIEIAIYDNKSSKPKSLLSVINKKPLSNKIVVVQPIQLEQEDSKQEPDVEASFKEIFSQWPRNEIPQNKTSSQYAFNYAVNLYSLETVKKVCSKYIDEMSDLSKASVRPLGMKRFLGEDDIFDNWKQRVEYVDDYDDSYFQVAYHIYPDFTDKESASTKEDSLCFYRRFINEENYLDFYCAVKSFRSDRRDEIRENMYRDDYNENDDKKFTKSFCNFIRVWQKYPKKLFATEFLEQVFYKVLKGKVPYHIVYPDDHGLQRPLGWYYEKENNFVSALTKTLEKICECLTIGDNYDKIVRLTKVDYSLISEAVALAKLIAKTMPVIGKIVESE